MRCKRSILCSLSVALILAVFLQGSGTESQSRPIQTTSLDLSLTIQTERPYYGPDETVKIKGYLTDTNGTAVEGAMIAVEVKDPRNYTIFLDIIFSLSNGSFEDSFKLDRNAMLGEYFVYSTANAAGYPSTGGQAMFMVVTTASLSEKSSMESTLNETLLVHQAAMNDVLVRGNLTGILDFTHFEMANITTGSFAGKGFSKGEWNATLEGIPYAGIWRGMLYLKPSERKIYLKGAISGEITGIVDGCLSETVNQSGTYDRYHATWTIGRLRTTIVSATLSLNGTLVYQSSSEYTATGLRVLQVSVEGSAFGHYNCSLSSMLTHVQVLGGSAYSGEGFSVISFVSNYGMGEGWTYSGLVSPGIIEMNGFLTAPLYGIVYATLNETILSRSLRMYIERVDLGLPPMADVKVTLWGPERVSPGQTITYSIELRNDGLKSAENSTVILNLPANVTYRSSTGGGFYHSRFNEIVWRFATIPAKSLGHETATVVVAWGLQSNTIIHPISAVPTSEIDVLIDHDVSVTEQVLEATGSYVEMESTISKGSTSGILDTIAFVEPIMDAIDASFGISTAGDEITITYEFTVGGAPAEEVFGFGNQRVWGFVTGAKWAWDWITDTYDTYEDHQEAIEGGKKREDILLFALETGFLEPESYESMSDWSQSKSLCEFVIPNALKYIPYLGRIYHSVTTDIMKSIDRAFFLPMLLRRMMIDNPENAPTSIEEMLEMYYNARSGAISSMKSRVVVARDPNVKYGLEGYTSLGQPLSYAVEFENEGEGTAYGVYFTDILDLSLNDSSLQIGPVVSTFNGSVIAEPGTYNPSTRTITWLVGEVGPGEGGISNFSIRVRDDAPEGTEIVNSATVYFPSVPETTRTNTIVSVVGHPGIAITGLAPLETAIVRGSILYLNLTLANEGYFAETFNVTLYVNSTTIRTQNIMMPGRSEEALLFMWNTTGFSVGSYNISAYAWPVPGENDTSDNNFIGVFVAVTVRGDVDGDNDVDIFDIVRMAGVYGVEQPDPRYDANCDLDGDGDIDIFDIVIAAGNYGKSW